MLWSSGANAKKSIGNILGYAADTTRISHTSSSTPNLAKPYFIFITMPQYVSSGIDTGRNTFAFYVPVTANTSEFIDYEPQIPQKLKLSSNSGLSSRLEFNVTSTLGPGVGFSRNTADWAAVFEVVSEN